ncbi:MAG: hypothetical protein KatS3mg125_0736 [Lysobacterales bacterium]|jgi:hypothetical protein|nr:MAG: hypothetical protein KatS3mg125_0736 [Xanthomonadales bacterium]
MSAPEPSGIAPSSHRGLRLAAMTILACAALLLGGWWFLGGSRKEERAATVEDALGERLRRRIERIEAQAAEWEAAARRREDRLADLERVHRGLREELLALRERIDALDRSLESLLERQRSSAAQAALAELDHLLAAAELRDRLLLDRRGALALLRAAREFARERPEPIFAELERAIAADLVWLERHDPDPAREALLRRLSELAELTPALIARDRDDARPASARRAGLERLIRIERIGEPTLPLLPEPVARMMFAFELRLLELAASMPDPEGFERARRRLSELLTGQFVGPERDRALAILAELAEVRLLPASSFPERARTRVRSLLAEPAAPAPASEGESAP